MKRIFFNLFGFILLTILILEFVISPLIFSVVEHYLHNQITAYYRSLVKGIFYMVESDLDGYAEDQWTQRISSLKPNFGFPLNLRKGGDIALGEEARDQLAAGLIVVQEKGEMFYQKVGTTGGVLAVGPIKDLENDEVWLEAILWVPIVLIVGVLTVLWAMPFWFKLRRISTAAIAFGNGQFETRARVPRRSSLAPLAAAFNSMAERIQQLIDTQKELTSAISHELRTPISRARFSLEMLEDTRKDAERRHYLAEILKDIDELDDLVDESLTYARFDRETPTITWQPCALAPWLQDIAGKALRGHPSIVFRCHNRLASPETEVHLEPRYMGRAIGNLIQNAARHAEYQIEVTLIAAGDECEIHVDDDGAGILESDRERIFQAFTRLDNSRNRTSGGFGLGLAIVQRVVTWHGGQVQVTDSPLGGARFTIRWPGLKIPPSEVTPREPAEH